MRSKGIEISSIYDEDLEQHVSVSDSDLIYPCIGAMSMGWSWALFLANEAIAYIAKQTGPYRSLEFRDKLPAPQLWEGSSLISTYVDNVSVIGAHKQDVIDRCNALSKKFGELDIPVVWSYEEPQQISESVGVIIDFSAKTIRNKPRRLWRVYLAGIALCKRSKVRGECVEVWFGHATSIFRLAPHFLSCFRNIYKFADIARGKRSFLWPCVIGEIRQALRLVWLARAELGGEHCKQVDIGDSSDLGYALMTRDLDSKSIRDMAKFKEKWRYIPIPAEVKEGLEMLWAGAAGPEVAERVQSFVRYGAGLDTEYAGWAQERLAEGSWLKTSAITTQWNARSRKRADAEIPALVKPIPEYVLDVHAFKLLWSRKWRISDEHIDLKEGRVLLSSLVRTCRVGSLFGCKKLSLSDNLACLLAFDKGRSSSIGLNRICKRAAAYIGATGVKWAIRHVETKRNVADKPSRIFDGDFSSSVKKIQRGVRMSPLDAELPSGDASRCTSEPRRRRTLNLADVVPLPGLDVNSGFPYVDNTLGSGRAEDIPLCMSDDCGKAVSSKKRRRRRLRPVFWEIFSGCSTLSDEMQSAGFRTLPPIDIKRFPYIDLCDPANQRIVREIIVSRAVSYIHFGTPCNVFSRARRNISNHSRARQRELVGCELATFTVEMCCLASRLGIKWLIENPRSSRLWEFPLFDALYGCKDVITIDFDMCRYNTPYKKPTRLLTNFSMLQTLNRLCCHRYHEEVLKGKTLKHDDSGSRWVNKTELAGAYPASLCGEWAKSALTGLRNVSTKCCADDSQIIERFFSDQGSTSCDPPSAKHQSDFKPDFVNHIVFGQHSKAEASRRRAWKQKASWIKAFAKKNFDCPH